MDFVRRALFDHRDDNVFAVLDGARIENLKGKLCDVDQKSLCLYRGDLDPELEAVAPHLVLLNPDSPFTDFVLSGWGRHRGVFAIAAAESRLVHRQLRRLQLVIGPGGRTMLFRYYDPRVLRAYLPTCNAQECSYLFGPIAEYVVEGEEPNELMRFRAVNGEVSSQSLRLDSR